MKIKVLLAWGRMIIANPRGSVRGLPWPSRTTSKLGSRSCISKVTLPGQGTPVCHEIVADWEA